MWCPMMPAHSWRTLLGSPSAYGVKTPLINPNYAGGHRLSSLIRGVPPTSRVSASEASRVDIARAFPTAGYGERRAQIGPDRSKIIVLSTRGDTSLEVLRCGEALSTVLPECTVAGMATCTLTHLTEITPSRMVIRQRTRQRGLPQLLIRVGTTPAAGEQQRPPTPRRPVTEVLQFHRSPSRCQLLPHQLRVRPQRSVRSTGSQLRHCETS
jgi:hypothetical protein